jgi:hypothetical protein
MSNSARKSEDGNKTVSLFRERLDVTRGVGVVVERLAQFFDGGVETVLEIDESVLRPEAVAKFFASDDYAGTLDQNGQDFDGLAVQVELVPEFEEFTGLGIELESSEADYLASEHSHSTHPRLKKVYEPKPGDVSDR